MRKFAFLVLPLLMWSASVQSSSANGHAPIGVMADHMHKSGEFMTSYRYGYMQMAGNRKDCNRVSIARVHDDFMVSPIRMSMQMHMFGAMYGLTDTVTAMAMIPLAKRRMSHITRMGQRFTTESCGVGDLKLSAMYALLEGEQHRVHVTGGLSCPTGGINHKDETPMGKVRLPYPMQLGSGTWDILANLTYNGFLHGWAWGGQLGGTYRTCQNKNKYRLGHEFLGSAWLSYNVAKWMCTSLRAEGQYWGNIAGADRELNPMMVPTARTDLRGGGRIDLFAGMNLLHDWLHGHRVAVEVGMPVYQNLRGPQLEVDKRIIAGWQLAF